MATLKLYLDTRSKRKDGTFPIKIQLTHLSKVVNIHTKIHILEKTPAL